MSNSKKRRLERERKQRRNSIIDTAERFFIEQGFDQTMVDNVALQAGYTKATIYNYFESKDDLFIAVAARGFEKLLRIMKAHLERPDVKYELRSLGDAYLFFVEEYTGYAGLIDSGQLGVGLARILGKEKAGKMLTQSEKDLREHQLKIQELMTDVITVTMKEADVEKKVDPLPVIMALSSIGVAIRELVMRVERGSQTKEATREYLDVLFNIIDNGLKHYNN
ncbi:MAG: TetR/AcrR family transcriptional regulator [Promethearchaeota archaeon]